MKSKLIFARIFRTIARILSILIILLGIPFLLFVGLQLLSSEPGNQAVFLYLLLLVGMLAGLVIAWRRESLGDGNCSGCAILRFVVVKEAPQIEIPRRCFYDG